MRFKRSGIMLLMLAVVLSLAALPARPAHAAEMSSVASVLGATNMDGIPSGVEAGQWLAASGFVIATPGADGKDSVTVYASNLVPGGLYTLWWVNTTPAMSMGPGGGTPANEFTADANGQGRVTISVDSGNDYQTLVLAYHADGMTHGEMPGEMGTETFSHLVGAFPGKAGQAAVGAAVLGAVSGDGIPAGIEAAQWNSARAFATATRGMNGQDTIVLRASGLVPNGLYTFWWVNDMQDMARMSMGPAGGTPANEFSADANGNALAAISVASANDYQVLVLAYHADGMTHGEMPGEMGTETFGHLMGAFPREVVSIVTALGATDGDGVPAGTSADAWLQAAAVAALAPGAEGQDTVLVYATGLVPNGLYTFWWVNDMQDMARMSMGPAGGTPANEFSADANGNALAAISVASANDYQVLVLAYHADGMTHGEMPGEMGTETFGHLMGAFPGPVAMMQ